MKRWIVECENRIDIDYNDNIELYISTLRAQAKILEELRDRGFVFSHRDPTAFWFYTMDEALAANYGPSARPEADIADWFEGAVEDEQQRRDWLKQHGYHVDE